MHPNIHSSTIYYSQDMEQPKCRSTEEWIKEMGHIHTMEYYSAIKKNRMALSEATRMDLEIVITLGYPMDSSSKISTYIIKYALRNIGFFQVHMI